MKILNFKNLIRNGIKIILLCTIFNIVINISTVSAIESTNELIDRIAKINYQEFQSNANSELLQSFYDSNKEFGLDGNLPNHKCKHEHYISKIKEKMLNVNPHLISANANSKMVQQVMDTGNRQPIRILFNTSLIMTDPYACHETGQVVATGLDPTSNMDNYGSLPPCQGDGDDPCMYTCKSSDVIDESLFNLTTSILKTMSDTFSSLILVDRSERLYLDKIAYESFNGQCSYGLPVPQSAVTDGIPDTDLVVYVTVRPPTSNNIIAYALACNYPVRSVGVYGRPMAATINFNPFYYRNFIGTNTDQFTYNQYIRVGIHEMIHSLGFSSTFYDSFTRADGSTFSAADNVKRSGTTPSGNRYDYHKSAITSPNVVQFVQNHYGCSSASYAELEDAGGSGTAGSHWETRTAGEEIMVGFASPVAPITNLTLNLLKDTGWYDIDYDRAEQFLWGKGLGCEWLDNCYEYTWNFQGYFCDKTGVTSCTGTRMGKGICVIADYDQNLPAPYQHFNDKQLGGINEAADYCPYYQISKNVQNTLWCGDTTQTTTYDSSVGEIFGASSRCFEFKVAPNSTVANTACWPMQCNGLLPQIQISGQWITCETDGQIINVNDIYVVCPQGFAECGGTTKYIEIGNPYSSSSILLSDMTRILLITLFYILLISNILGHSHKNNNNLIDNIVSKQSYLKFQDLKRDISEGAFNTEESYSYSPLPSYKCQHERLAEKWRNQLNIHISDTTSKDNVIEYDIIENKVKKNENIMNLRTLSAVENQELLVDNNSHTIRILFNTTYLDNDQYSCSSVGQKILVGDSSTLTGKVVTQSCDDEGTYNECIYTCTQQDLLNSDLRTVITQYIIPAIKSSLETYIMIPQYNSPDVLKLSSTCATLTKGQCIYGVPIPNNYLNPGIPNYDMVIWVTSRPTTSKETIAYALPCNQNIYVNNKFGRPLAGSINFNPMFYTPFIKNPNLFTFNEYIRVGIHEMTHALGFTSTLYNSYLNKNGHFYDASTVVTRSSVTPNGVPYSYQKYAINSPNVVNFIQQHYQCMSIQYAELEDSGSSGTAGSHWEKRTAGEEYMIGYVSPIAPITNLTLALLLDTGWYNINTTAAEDLVWGRNLGCKWLDSCSAESWNYQGYFCDISGMVGCTPTRVGKGMCGKTEYTSALPPQYQHYNKTNVGGIDEVADFCPYFQVFSNQKQTYYCGDTSNSPMTSVGEYFGQDSRCFEYKSGSSSIGQACWQHRCFEQNVEINIKGTWIRCNESGQEISANGVTVVCPFGGFAECNGVPIQVLVQEDSGASIMSPGHSIIKLFTLSISIFLSKYF